MFHTPYSIFHTSYSRRGFSLVEMLFYIALLALSLIAVMQALLAITRSYGALKVEQHMEQDATSALERMVREIRDAKDTDDAGSIFGSNPGKLRLSSTDASSTPKTVEFYLDGGKIMLKENGVISGPLTSGKSTVPNLVFRKVTTLRSKGVKIEVTMQGGVGVAARTELFYATAVLRDSY